MAWQEGDDLALLAVLTALALAQGKDVDELGVLSGFIIAVGDILALLAVVLAAEENAQAESKEKQAAQSLEARLKNIEEQLNELKACCDMKG